MKVVDVPVDQIDEDPANPNRMTDAKYRALVHAIRILGFNQNAIVEGPGTDGRFSMRDGNHRLRAAREVGMATIPCVVAPPGSKLAEAAPLTLNNVRGEVDHTAAAEVLSGMILSGWAMEDLAVTGFTDQEISDLVSATWEASPDELLGGGGGSMDDLGDETIVPATTRPFLLEVDFDDRKTFVAVRRALRRAAGKGRPLFEGLVKVLGLEPSS